MMKKMILSAALLLAVVLTKAASEQVTPDSQTTKPNYIYCELIGYPAFNRITVTVDLGQERGSLTDTRLRDEQTGRIRTFYSMIDALNFMSEDGWEFVQAYSSFDGEHLKYHWILKKEKE